MSTFTTIQNQDVRSAAGIVPTKLALTDAHIIVGNSGAGSDVAMSGDATINDSGVVTVTWTNAPTFTTTVEGVVAAPGSTAVSNGYFLKADGTWALPLPSLTDSHIFVGNSSNVSTDVAVSGDATLADNGALTVDWSNATAGSFNVNTLSLTSGDIIVGNGSNQGSAVVMSGDASINSSGTVTVTWANFPNSQNFITASNLPNFADNEVPSGTVNGSNNQFSLVNIPVSNSEHLFKNGLRQLTGVDYTMSGNTIYFASGNYPQSGDNLVCDYRY